MRPLVRRDGSGKSSQVHYRAVLIGETTAGSSGQPLFIDLGDGFRAWIGTKRETFPDGRAFEGVGIAPDMEIVQTATDLREGKDRVLGGALMAVMG